MGNPITVYKDTHLWVPWAALDTQRLFEDLVITDETVARSRMFGNQSKKPDKVALWEDMGEWALLPRGYDPPYLEGLDIKVVRRGAPPAKREPWPFYRDFRPHQVPAAEALLKKKGDKLLCMGCGKGKTTMALWYAATKGEKTLVIVDRDFLTDQWKDEIADILHIAPEDVGHIQADKRIIGEQITIALVHTLAQQEFDEDFYNQFGLIIIDEAHVMAAPTFAGIVPAFRGERLLLTATPFRRDGMYPLFMLHGGGLSPCYTDLTRTQSTKWYFKTLPHVKHLLDEAEIARCYRKMPNGKRTRRVVRGKLVEEHQQMLMRPRYETYLAKSVVAHTHILNEVERAANTGRNLLFLGTRVEQLEYYHGYFGEALDLDSGLITGEVKGDARRAAFNHQCLFITTSIGNKALDVPRLDTLFLMYPTDDEGFIRQAVGRIDRELEGKRNPLAVVFHHLGTPSLERKSHEMIEKILNIDPKAEVRFV